MRRLALATLLPASAAAHPGHGPSALTGLWHWIATPEHGLPLLAAGLALGWILYRRRRTAR